MQTLAPPATGWTVQADPGQPVVDGLESAADAAQTAETNAAPIVTGAAPALWAGAGAFLLVFVVVLMLIIRGRVIGAAPRKHKSHDTSTTTFFEPAGEDADITFDEDEEQAPQRGKRAARKESWRDDRDSEVTIERASGPHQGDLHDTPAIEAPAPSRAAAKKKRSAFAGLFAKKPPAEPEPIDSEEPADEAYDAEAEDEGMLAAVSGWDATEEEPVEAPQRLQLSPHTAPGANTVGAREADTAARQALQRAADAEALARDLKRANEEAERVMSLSLRRQEEALEEKAEALNAMEKRLTALADDFHARAPAALPAHAPAPHLDADEHAVSEEHFAEFANLMGEQFDALRASVNDAIERVSQRIDRMPQTAAAVTCAPVVLPSTASRIQLADLLSDALAPQRFALAKKLSTGRTADAVIATPPPSAPIAIDARFPVEAFDAWSRARGSQRADELETELRRIVLRHIADASEKLIGAQETADCAILFVPSEHILSELHAHFADVVQESYRARVFMTGPTSLMATLHTISGVLSGGREHMPAHAVIDELGDLRRRVNALEARAGANGAAAPSKPAAPKPATAATPHTPAQYANLFEAGPAHPEAPDGDEKSPFPLR